MSPALGDGSSAGTRGSLVEIADGSTGQAHNGGSVEGGIILVQIGLGLCTVIILLER